MDDRTEIKQKKPKKTSSRDERVPCLIVLEGGDIGKIYEVAKNSVVIGRSEEADIVISEMGVSRKHARVDRLADGVTLADLDSTNGTFLNGDPVKQSSLQDGDKLQIGEVILRFAYQDAMDVSYQANLRNMAMRDGLTRVFNRRYFREVLDREISYCLRQRQPLTCVMFDIDHFKKVNDTYGHAGGDEVLKKLASMVAGVLRRYDLLARYGGEEFAILLRATALDNAIIFADRLRERVEKLRIKHDGHEISFTISVGLATLDPDTPLDGESLVKQADRYLYEAKRKGRNCVCSARSAED